MPCANHPEVVTGLDTCTRCAKTFCIDCLVGRKAGWFCSACDKELGAAPASAKPPEDKPAAAPVPATPIAAAPPKPAGPKSCANHPDVLDLLNPCSSCGKSFCPDCLVELKGERFCAGCKINALKDIQSGVESGTGLQLAGILPRFCAHLIDSMAINAVILPLFFVMGLIISLSKPDPNSVVFPMVGCGVWVLVIGAMFGYHALMIQWKGQTLGKMALRIKVVNPEGGPITPGQAWIRVLVWFLLSGCGITYIPAFFNKEKMTIHDMAARTRVVKI